MKKIHKAGIIAAGIFAVAGAGLCAAAVLAGVDIQELREDGEQLSGIIREEAASDSANGQEKEQIFSNITKIDAELDYASMEIVGSEDENIRVVLSDGAKRIQCRQDGDTLEISDDDANLFSAIFSNKNENVKIRVEIPEKMLMRKTELQVGAGEIRVENLNTDELDIDCDAGSIEFCGTILHAADVECNVGEINMSLMQEEREFNYQVECNVGSISIGSNTMEGIATERTIDNGAGKQMDVECNVGEIHISFTEN